MNGVRVYQHNPCPPYTPSAIPKASRIEGPERLTPRSPRVIAQRSYRGVAGYLRQQAHFRASRVPRYTALARGTRHERGEGGSTQPVPSVHPECETEGLAHRGTRTIDPPFPPSDRVAIVSRGCGLSAAASKSEERRVGKERVSTGRARG